MFRVLGSTRLAQVLVKRFITRARIEALKKKERT
jgi:hypothetical protein